MVYTQNQYPTGALPELVAQRSNLRPRVPVNTMHIEAKKSGDTLTLALSGRLDSTSARALAEALQLEGVHSLTLDLEQCRYVSSAGLREILRAHKSMVAKTPGLVLTNVHREVFEVFTLTGFTDLISIRRKVREISMAGLEFMSAGVCGECYRLDEETIVKVYNEGISADIAEQEKAFAKAAFVLGIPTAISYDVVTCGNRTGVVYEMLDAKLFSVIINNDLANIAQHGASLAQIVRTIHSTTADPAIFPNLKQKFVGYINQMDFCVSADDIAFLQAKLATIPEGNTCVHFDIHTSNIMIRDSEPVIIDMGDLSRGSYLFDIGLLCTIYGIPELGICELATKIPTAKGVELWEHFLAQYFADKSAEEYAFFHQNRYFLASLRIIYTITFLPKLRNQMVQLLKTVLLPGMRAAD